MSQNEAAQYWEERYSTATQVWSGRANASVVAVASELTPGTALDLGCGEGGDSLWLAEQGWRVTGVDISPTAVRRGADEAARRGIPADRNTWVAADLETWTTDQRFDLVSACFLQSNVTLSREAILRRAATLVAPGGHLLVVAHAAPPRCRPRPRSSPRSTCRRMAGRPWPPRCASARRPAPTASRPYSWIQSSSCDERTPSP